MASRLRTVVVRSAAFGGLVVGGALAFPRFEDWYWHKKNPDRVSNYIPNSDETTQQGDDAVRNHKRKKLVIVGSGWASVSMLQNIDRDKYEITVISPRNYFLFTPLLPSATVGTISNEAVTIPVREFTSYKTLPILQRLNFMWRGYLPPRCRYIFAAASDLDPDQQILTCQHPNDNVPTETFQVPYDHLVIATGATTNTFNTEGVDKYCHYLKETGDAVLIRQKILNNLERATLPGITTEEQKKLLTFVVVGGGPTGVEFAAELQDLLVGDVVNPTHSTYARLVGVPTVRLLQSNQKLLPGFAAPIQDFAESHLRDMDIDLRMQSRVMKVTEDEVYVLNKQTDTMEHSPYGMIVWATGVSPGRFVKKIIAKLPDSHVDYRSLKTDGRSRVLGLKNVFAVGDCADIDVHATYRTAAIEAWNALPKDKSGTRLATVESQQTFLLGLFKSGDLCDLDDGNARVLNKIVESLEKQHLVSTAAASSSRGKFQGFSKLDILSEIEKQFKRQKFLPATAQVANQQGTWLASLFNNPKEKEDGSWSFDHAKPFAFQNKGQLVYVGGHMAALSVPTLNEHKLTWNGSLTNYIWHCAYFGMHMSWSGRYELFVDWMRSLTFGRSTVLDSLCTSDSQSQSAALTRTLQLTVEGNKEKQKKSGWFW